MKRYIVEKWGSLFIVKAAVGGLEDGVKVLRTLVDTGSTYTILPYEILESIGLDPAVSRERVRIVTGSGYIIAPRTSVRWFHCLGQRIEDFKVVAHNLPFGISVDGLLGMDFLTKVKAVIHTTEDMIEVE